MFFYSTQLLEYSLIVMSVISIGHISTTALAATSLGSMTASVSGYSIILGMTTALDTILPSAWTSNQPQLVGLWAQRMSQSIKSLGLCHVNSDSVITTAVVVFISLAVSPLLKNLSSTDSVSQPILLIWFNAESILIFLNQEPEIAHLAAIYLRWASLGLPGIFLTSSFLSFCAVANNIDLGYAFNCISR